MELFVIFLLSSIIVVLYFKGKEKTTKKKTKTPKFRVIEWKGSDLIVEVYGTAYRGNGTVWRHTKTGKRAGTSLESELSNVWTREKWKKEDE